MLSILLAPDSLKGSLSAPQACIALENGARRALNEVQSAVTHIPLADGGEGTLESLLRAVGGTLHTQQVRNPLGETIDAQWAQLVDGRAVIEMAQASGLTLIPSEQRDALRASSHGTGELMRAALDAGCRQILIGIGGSATTDGGTGALQALGAHFVDEHGYELPPGGEALSRLAGIDLTNLDARLPETSIEVLCDVTNPLHGEQGAAFIYGPQKGATPEDVLELDAALQNYADVASQVLGHDYRETPGAGAAGGMGFGLIAFCGAKLVSGIDKVLSIAHFGEKLETADLVLTAEGAIDAQTLSGKALYGIAQRAAAAKDGAGVPVIAFGGAVKLSGAELQQMGIVAALPLPNAPMTLEKSVADAETLLGDAAERAVRLWLSGLKVHPHAIKVL